MSTQPIGVFDSGIGGLTVAGVLCRRLPHESIVYLGDTARVPYGTKSADVVRKYAERCAAFLLQQNVKMLIVACNTASAHALEHLQATLPIPVLGVIGPGAAAAAAMSQNHYIGVIATRGTIDSGAYRRALTKRLPSVRVVEAAGPLLVPMAEEGLIDHPATRLMAEEYLRPMIKMGVDTIVLGCTHYPVLRNVIEEITGPSIKLTDSGEAVTTEAASELARLGLAAPNDQTPRHQFFLTDTQSRFADLSERFFGQRIEHATRVDL